MSGYTPLFSSLTTGTLCGKWPDIGLWAIVLSLADYRGVVDATPQYIASVTGMSVGDVQACMKRFCEPDPGSRSKTERGARLVLVDPDRDWGWRVVNIQIYRARASGRNQIVDGRNAEKVRRYKERHRKTPSDTSEVGQTPTHTHTHTHTQTTDSDKNKKPDRRTARAVDEPPAGFVELQREYPKRAGGQRWGDALKFYKRRLAEGEQPETILAGVRRYAEFTRAVGIERTEKVQQAATFLGDNRGYLEQWQAPARAKSAVEQAREDLRKNRHVDSTVVSEQGPGTGNSDLGSFARLLR